MRLVQPPLQRFDYLLLERRRTGVPERTDGNLTAVRIPAVDIHQDFHVTGAAFSWHHASDLQIRGGLARGLMGNERDGSYGEPILYDHGPIVIVDRGLQRITFPKNLLTRYALN